MSIDGGEFTERTYGVLPEGARVKRSRIDTKTYIEQGERTWTTGQTVRDILQNHLDANTQVYFDTLVSAVFDTEQLNAHQLHGHEALNFDNFTYVLYRYAKSHGDLSPEAEAEVQAILQEKVKDLPIKPDFLRDGKIDMESIREAVGKVQEEKPRILYKIKDLARPDEEPQWVTLEEFRGTESYYEDLANYDDPEDTGIPEDMGIEMRFQITALRIEDSGSGFDSKLTAFYKSTKTGKRHLRGKFGEGAKLSETHLLRHGASIKMRSGYKMNAGSNRERWWQNTAYVGEDDVVKLKGVEIDIPTNGQRQYGSRTTIDIENADSQFQDEFRAEVDPRYDGGIEINANMYSPHTFYFPSSDMLNLNYGVAGVSLGTEPQFQYVQGLKVGVEEESYYAPLFSYDFQDSSILQGRDRNRIRDARQQHIRHFWQHADNPELAKALIQRVYVDDYGAAKPPEEEVLEGIIKTSDNNIFGEQAKRAKRLVMQLIPEVMGLEDDHKYVVISEYDKNSPANKRILGTLEQKGYTIFVGQHPMSYEAINAMNRAYQGRFEIHSFLDIKDKLDTIVGEVSVDDERRKEAESLYVDSYIELEDLFDCLGLPALASIGNPVFVESIEPQKDLPVELSVNKDRNEFFLRIRPDAIFWQMMRGKEGKDYWKKRMQIELLATVGRTSHREVQGFANRDSLYMASQRTAQSLLDKSLDRNAPDAAVLPSSISYVPEPRDTSTIIAREQFPTPEAMQHAKSLYDQSRLFTLSFEDAVILVRSLEGLPKGYRGQIETILGQRLWVEEGFVKRFKYVCKDGKYLYEFETESLEKLDTGHEVDGKKIYRVDNTLFMPIDVPDGTVIAQKDRGEKFVRFGDTLLKFEPQRMEVYEYQGYNTVKVQSGALAMNFSMPHGIKDISEYIGKFTAAVSQYTINPSEVSRATPMKTTEGIVHTPISSEYGKNEWDNPVRVFQDIIQNHLDASTNGLVRIMYGVEREGKRKFVPEREITKEDTIVGFAVVDNGKGYPPNDLGTMGKSSKKSPFFAGKYGEGQKMVAASAARNGFELLFSSLASLGDTRYRWTARVGQQEEELIIGGEGIPTQQVVFHVDSKEAVPHEASTSQTIIKLPQEATGEQQRIWAEWMRVIDPRNKDEKGFGGLARYVLSLRPKNSSQVIDLGYMKVLLDEPGVVYENGLFITDTGNTMFGYDVPEVVSTRERNAYDFEKFKGYIRHASHEIVQPAFVETVVRRIRDKYIEPFLQKDPRASFKEIDANINTLFAHSVFIPSTALWRKTVARILPGVYVHCDIAIKSELEAIQSTIQGTIQSAYNVPGGAFVSDSKKRAQRLRATLANLQHIPEGHLVQLYDHSQYNNWKNVFPTAYEYVMGLEEQRVPVDTDTQNLLRTLAQESAKAIYRSTWLDPVTLASILTESVPSGLKKDRLDYAQADARREYNLWKQATSLPPDSVFVAPQEAGYLGLANRDKIGFNESLLMHYNPSRLAGTARHELTHKIFNLSDYTPEFIMMLLQQAQYNVEQSEKINVIPVSEPEAILV